MLTNFIQSLAPFFFTLLGLVVAHVVLAVAVSLAVTHDFSWKKLSDFLSVYAPKVVSWIAIEAFSLIPADVIATIPGGEGTEIFVAGFSKVIFGLIALSATAGILTALKELGVMPGGLSGVLMSAGAIPKKEAVKK